MFRGRAPASKARQRPAWAAEHMLDDDEEDGQPTSTALNARRAGGGGPGGRSALGKARAMSSMMTVTEDDVVPDNPRSLAGVGGKVGDDNDDDEDMKLLRKHKRRIAKRRTMGHDDDMMDGRNVDDVLHVNAASNNHSAGISYSKEALAELRKNTYALGTAPPPTNAQEDDDGDLEDNNKIPSAKEIEDARRRRQQLRNGAAARDQETTRAFHAMEVDEDEDERWASMMAARGGAMPGGNDEIAEALRAGAASLAASRAESLDANACIDSAKRHEEEIAGLAEDALARFHNAQGRVQSLREEERASEAQAEEAARKYDAAQAFQQLVSDLAGMLDVKAPEAARALETAVSRCEVQWSKMTQSRAQDAAEENELLRAAMEAAQGKQEEALESEEEAFVSTPQPGDIDEFGRDAGRERRNTRMEARRAFVESLDDTCGNAVDAIGFLLHPAPHVEDELGEMDAEALQMSASSNLFQDAADELASAAALAVALGLARDEDRASWRAAMVPFALPEAFAPFVQADVARWHILHAPASKSRDGGDDSSQKYSSIDAMPWHEALFSFDEGSDDTGSNDELVPRLVASHVLPILRRALASFDATLPSADMMATSLADAVGEVSIYVSDDDGAALVQMAEQRLTDACQRLGGAVQCASVTPGAISWPPCSRWSRSTTEWLRRRVSAHVHVFRAILAFLRIHPSNGLRTALLDSCLIGKLAPLLRQSSRLYGCELNVEVLLSALFDGSSDATDEDAVASVREEARRRLRTLL